MKLQLTLLEAPPDWRIDERTKEIGRRGLARARAVLQSHSPSDGGVPGDDRQRADRPTPRPSDDVPRAA